MTPKFRAWDKRFSEFMEDFFVSEDGKIYKKSTDTGYGIAISRETSNEVILMQSTGLFDKNNKEIFEGDIVLVLDSPYTVFYDTEKGSYRLKPHDDRWNVDYMSNFSHGGNFEIIGNIYENKEQL
ncbi:YopX family protein [Streptococcus infantis]|uniref:YopX family protein n=1 Tax=Streptococcus infantis TaxID=68892 RepID=UPI0039C3A5D4